MLCLSSHPCKLAVYYWAHCNSHSYWHWTSPDYYLLMRLHHVSINQDKNRHHIRSRETVLWTKKSNKLSLCYWQHQSSFVNSSQLPSTYCLEITNNRIGLLLSLCHTCTNNSVSMYYLIHQRRHRTRRRWHYPKRCHICRWPLIPKQHLESLSCDLSRHLLPNLPSNRNCKMRL